MRWARGRRWRRRANESGEDPLFSFGENVPGNKKPPDWRPEERGYYGNSHFSKIFYAKCPEMLDRALKKEYNTILHQYAK